MSHVQFFRLKDSIYLTMLTFISKIMPVIVLRIISLSRKFVFHLLFLDHYCAQHFPTSIQCTILAGIPLYQHIYLCVHDSQQVLHSVSTQRKNNSRCCGMRLIEALLLPFR